MTMQSQPETHEDGPAAAGAAGPAPGAACALPLETAVFLHLPKTAGSSLRAAIEGAYPADSVYRLEPDAREAAARLVAMAPAERAGYRLISGHQVYGLHRYASGEAGYLAMLREPLARAVSDLRHRRRVAGGELGQEELRDALLGRGDRELATRDNLYTRWLSATPGLAEAYADGVEPDASAYERACAHWDADFAWVGVTERFYESSALLEGVLGRRLVAMPRLNVSPGGVAFDAGDGYWSEAAQAFASRNVWDMRLYARALAGVESSTTPEVLRRAQVLARAGRRVPLGRAFSYVRRHGFSAGARRALSVLRGGN